METEIIGELESLAGSLGFEVAPFKVKWYNSSVTNNKFVWDWVDDEALALIVISQPCMFEKAFLPFVVDHWKEVTSNAIADPLDQCMKHCFQQLKNRVNMFDQDVKGFHDFELAPNRRPKVLVQTAGHVSGAVRFYQEKDSDPSLLEREPGAKVYPVCLHPEWGGWFALRGVLIFPNILVPDLTMKTPPEVLKATDEISDLLNLYNNHWRDNRFRDCAPKVSGRYSKDQQNYFALPPGEKRLKFLSELLKLPLPQNQSP